MAVCLLILFFLFESGCGRKGQPAQQTPTDHDTIRPSTGYAIAVGVERILGEEVPGVGTAGSGTDARAIHRMLGRLGFQAENMTLLITEAATRGAVLGALQDMSARVQAQDLLVVYFSGHGGQRVDADPGDEDDLMDETIVCYDGSILDDELLVVFQRFPASTRMVFINDACNSGTTHHIFNVVGSSSNKDVPLEHSFIMAYDPFDVERFDATLKAQLIYFGGASDGTDAQGGPAGGLFTKALRTTMTIPERSGSYGQLFHYIRKKVQTHQLPTYAEMGPIQTGFRDQRPFTIKPPIP